MIGEIVGGGLAILGNVLGSQNEKEGIRKASDKLTQAQKDAYAQQLAGLEQLRAMYPNDQQIQQEYEQARRAFEGFDARVDMPEFDQSKYGAEQFLDPYIQYEGEQANRALQSSLQGKGGLYSGKAMQALQQQSQQFAGRNLAQARAEAMNQKQFDYNDYLRHFQNLRDNASLERERLGQVLQGAMGARGDVQSLIGKKAELGASNAINLGNIAANRARGLYGIDSTMYSNLGSALGGLASQGINALGSGSVGGVGGDYFDQTTASLGDPRTAGVMTTENQFADLNNGSWDALTSSPFGGNTLNANALMRERLKV